MPDCVRSYRSTWLAEILSCSAGSSGRLFRGEVCMTTSGASTSCLPATELQACALARAANSLRPSTPAAICASGALVASRVTPTCRCHSPGCSATHDEVPISALLGVQPCLPALASQPTTGAVVLQAWVCGTCCCRLRERRLLRAKHTKMEVAASRTPRPRSL